MQELLYPVLLAPQTAAPICADDPVVVGGRRMSAATALTRYTAEDLAGFGYAVPGIDETRAAAVGHVQQAANAALKTAANGYAWPEAAAWIALEQQARQYLADPAAGAGPDLAADVGDASDPAAVAARATVIATKADAFRVARGAIVRARRDALAAVDAADSVAAIQSAAAVGVGAVATAA